MRQNLMIFKLYLCHAYNEKWPKPTWYKNDDATIHWNTCLFQLDLIDSLSTPMGLHVMEFHDL
jgi:hypothetical protein